MNFFSAFLVAAVLELGITSELWGLSSGENDGILRQLFRKTIASTENNSYFWTLAGEVCCKDYNGISGNCGTGLSR
jgi:hypothetical protein